MAGYNYLGCAALLFFIVSGLVASIESVFNGGKESVTSFFISVEGSFAGSDVFVSLFSQAINKVDASRKPAKKRSGCNVLNDCCIDLIFNEL